MSMSKRLRFLQRSTFQFMCSSGAVSYTRVINDGFQRSTRVTTLTTTWIHIKTNVKNNSNSKCYQLDVIDWWRISNCKYTRLKGQRPVRFRAIATFRAPVLTDLRQQLIQLMEIGRWKLHLKAEMDTEHEHQMLWQLQSLSQSRSQSRFQFWLRKRTTCGASYKYPDHPLWTDLHMHTI